MSFLYCWYAPAVDGIKVGRGNNPWKRMEHYSSKHGLYPTWDSMIMLQCYGWSKEIETYKHTVSTPNGPIEIVLNKIRDFP
jgi:hypothetical protein